MSALTGMTFRRVTPPHHYSSGTAYDVIGRERVLGQVFQVTETPPPSRMHPLPKPRFYWAHSLDDVSAFETRKEAATDLLRCLARRAAKRASIVEASPARDQHEEHP